MNLVGPEQLHKNALNRTTVRARAANPNRSSFATQGPKPRKDFAAALLQEVVTLALRSRLRRCTDIAIDVDTDAFTLLSGKVRSAQVCGKLWESPMELTAQELRFGVGAVAIDYAALVSQRKILLHNEPQGQALIVFTAHDFGNFLVHPMMQNAARNAVGGRPFLFTREAVRIQLSPQPCVYFSGTLAGSTTKYSIKMVPSQQHVSVTTSTPREAEPPRGPTSGAVLIEAAHHGASSSTDAMGMDVNVSRDLTAFFNSLLIDLQGVNLTFESLALDLHAAAKEPVLHLHLSVRMLAFPPLNLRF